MADRTGRKPSAADQQEMQRKMEAAGTPGPAHKALEPMVGSWKAEVKCWHDPDGQPEESQATVFTVAAGSVHAEVPDGTPMQTPALQVVRGTEES